MDTTYKTQMERLGYDQFICDIFGQWEDVKDELLIPERKSGSGNGTIHVFLGAADNELQKEFPDYYRSVKTESDAADGAIEITHYFLKNNIISMLGYVCAYNYSKGLSVDSQILNVLEKLSSTETTGKIISTTSLFKLSTGSNKLRPYFKQFERDGIFSSIIRKILLPNSAYKISLFKNKEGKYGAFWLIGFDDIYDFEADSDAKYIEKIIKTSENQPHQIIYYGAPGTGKSHKIKKELKDKNVSKENVFRTTFHPDSDYSTFVGAYKPFVEEQEVRAIPVVFNNGTSFEANNGTYKEKRITYKFVPQAFLQAYTRAYQTSENVYLVIEEINRGNCAQIFGDLFQLLDRDEKGKSEYTINADTDLGAYLIEKLGEDRLSELGLIKKSEDNELIVELCLPSNLYIYATMNTSDQSLFPIDSAFKRRWDWKYEPIKYKNTNWLIDIDGTMYSWTKFQEEVNNRILKDSGSEDKMMGDYFVNPPTGIISKSLFLNKILFYLWNDVCKDGDTDIFPSDNDFSFSKLHADNNTQVIKDMMERLGVEPVEEVEISDDEIENPSSDDEQIKQWYSTLWSEIAPELIKYGVDLDPNNMPTNPSRQYYQLSVGITGLSVIAYAPKTKDTCWVGLYVEKQQADSIYPKLLNLKETLDSQINGLQWYRKDNGHAKIFVSNSFGDKDNPEARKNLREWIARTFGEIYTVIKPLVPNLK